MRQFSNISLFPVLVPVLGLCCLCFCTPGNKLSRNFVQPTLASRSAKLLTAEGFQFKDLNKNGRLDPYEDWRQPVEKRVDNLLSQMTLEEKTGFMLISSIRMDGDNTFTPNLPKREITANLEERNVWATVNMFTRKPLRDSFLNISATTSGIRDLHLRHFILRTNASARLTATWANHLQALAEGTRLGIPAIVASNPRNHVTVDASMGLSQGSTVFSRWCGELGLAAARDTALARTFGNIAAQEWAAVGLRKGYIP